MIEFAPDIPRWRQVAQVLRRRIADGMYMPRSRVPSVVQLTAEFGVAAATAQKALRALRAEGLTYTEPGLGSFVTQMPPVSQFGLVDAHGSGNSPADPSLRPVGSG
ncbi:GntR family transcriptional regulator [Streptomyces sp. NPDC087297]|uniref:GntR family transcriptional regulator n=1 Tax=Streptomyces sp. NPDC087297 TaxID=3365778 RepID=UPI00381D4EF4